MKRTIHLHNNLHMRAGFGQGLSKQMGGLTKCVHEVDRHVHTRTHTQTHTQTQTGLEGKGVDLAIYHGISHGMAGCYKQPPCRHLTCELGELYVKAKAVHQTKLIEPTETPSTSVIFRKK